MRRYPKLRGPYARYQPIPARVRASQDSSAASSHVAFRPLAPTPIPTDPADPAGTKRRRHWSTKKIALIGTPLLIVAVVLILIAPTLLAARQAYNHIFVTRMPHLQVGLNAQGTPVIEEQSTTPTPAPVQANTGSQATPAASPVAVIASTIPALTPTVQLPTWNGTGRVNILLLGSDTRGDGDVARSDTIILVTINPATKQVSMLSIPRDLLVTIPNYGKDKINAAYAYGSMTKLTGPGLAAATIEYNFGVTIDYFAEVDTTGLARIIDTLGGVTLDVPAPIKDNEFPGSGNNYLRVLFHTGLQHMNGVAAVQYARTRHDDNDFARGDRQRQLLEGLRAQAVGLDLLPKAPRLLSQFGDTFKTDLSPTQVLALAKLGSGISSSNIHSYDLLQATSDSYSPGQPYYLIPNWPAIHQILNEMMSR